uniref:(northern house mosquito) hypothetical protein n=1 Tax=Culex pipiens TaxID=7175 RepID=A0A8D8CTJ5_CULPI
MAPVIASGLEVSHQLLIVGRLNAQRWQRFSGRCRSRRSVKRHPLNDIRGTWERVFGRECCHFEAVLFCDAKELSNRLPHRRGTTLGRNLGQDERIHVDRYICDAAVGVQLRG